jgi:hypothetical protein
MSVARTQDALVGRSVPMEALWKRSALGGYRGRQPGFAVTFPSLAEVRVGPNVGPTDGTRTLLKTAVTSSVVLANQFEPRSTEPKVRGSNALGRAT